MIFIKKALLYYKHMFNRSKNKVTKTTVAIGGKEIYIKSDYNFS